MAEQSKSAELHPIISEFSDVSYSPITPSQILRLDEPSSASHIYALMHAVLRTSERSARTHQLATAALEHNGSNVTAWLLRRQSAEALAVEDPGVWEKEMAFCASLITESESAKNYQAWGHRRFCATQFGLQHEREFTDIVLAEDEKNYHAWAHRAWLVRQGLKDGELHSTEWYITRDIRNNSAWNHRWMVLSTTGALLERGEDEMVYALKIMKKASNNEAVWNFINALCEQAVGKELALQAVRDILGKDERCLPPRRLLAHGALKQSQEEVKKHCAFLAQHDVIRRKYWMSLVDEGQEQEEQ
ncbi:unnamed protein product [Agarophyton chilense]